MLKRRGGRGHGMFAKEKADRSRDETFVRSETRSWVYSWQSGMEGGSQEQIQVRSGQSHNVS